MPRLEYFLVAESISVDRDSNQVSVFNILEEMSIPRPGPGIIPQLVALSSWILDPEDEGCDFQIGVDIVRPVGDKHQFAEFSLNFTAHGSRQRTYLRFTDIPVEKEGEIKFNLKLNGDSKATHILAVRWTEDVAS